MEDITKPKKKKKRVKKYVHLTKEVKEFIIEKIYGGMDILNISKKYPDKVPTADHIYKAPLKDKEFEKELEDAYTVLFMRRLDELEDLGSEDWCKDRLDKYGGDYKLAFEARRAIIDIKKFQLGKMAPVLSRKFQKQDKLEVTGIENTPIAIINYYSDSKNTTSIEGTVVEEEDNLLE